MDYDLSRIDYTICGITYPDTLKILPAPAPRAQQKVRSGLFLPLTLSTPRTDISDKPFPCPPRQRLIYQTKKQ